MVDERSKRRPVARDIDDEDRLVVEPELLPGDDLEGLVERAEAAGQHGEGVGQLEHPAFALVHAVDDDELADAGMADLAIVQVVGNDAGDAAAAGERRIGHEPHQPDPAAAIDEFDAGFGEERAEPDRRRAVSLIDPPGRAAINANTPNHRHSCRHSLHVTTTMLHRRAAAKTAYED